MFFPQKHKIHWKTNYFFTFGNAVKYKNETRLRLVFIFV